MLFQRLYNWIKYKTLPTSFLFKNRLFIERDTKTKRIFSNLGLTFRNSKWSDYTLFNIKLQFKSSFLVILYALIGFLALLLICLYVRKYYMFYYAFNLVAFNLWFSSDALDYYISFFVWLTTLFFVNLINSLHSYLFFNNFSNFKRLSVIPTNFKKKTLPREKLSTSTSFSYLVYSWLNSRENLLKTDAISYLFDTNTNLKWWNSTHSILHNTYKINDYLTKLSSSLSRTSADLKKNLELDETSIEKVQLFLTTNNTRIAPFNVSALLWYFVKQTPTDINPTESFYQTPVSFYNRKHNLQKITLESLNYGYLIHSKIGNFYTTNLNASHLINYIINFPELQFFTNNVSSQFLIAKWNRWLYRYSILHRKILKNSHKITTIKRLLNSGLYNFIKQDETLWSITKIGKLPVKNLLLSNLINSSSAVGDTNTSAAHYNINILNTNLSISKINNLNNYENSFFFFVKRFFFYNTLPSNNVYVEKISIAPNSDKFLKNLSHEKYIDTYLILLNYLLKNHARWLSQYDLTTPVFLPSKIYKTDIETEITHKSARDYFLYNEECDLLLPTNLNILYWTTTSLKTLYNFNFYHYNTFFSNSVANVESEFFETEDENAFSSVLYFSHQMEINTLHTFVNDFNMLSLLLFKIHNL